MRDRNSHFPSERMQMIFHQYWDRTVILDPWKSRQVAKLNPLLQSLPWYLRRCRANDGPQDRSLNKQKMFMQREMTVWLADEEELWRIFLEAFLFREARQHLLSQCVYYLGRLRRRADGKSVSVFLLSILLVNYFFKINIPFPHLRPVLWLFLFCGKGRKEEVDKKKKKDL